MPDNPYRFDPSAKDPEFPEVYRRGRFQGLMTGISATIWLSNIFVWFPFTIVSLLKTFRPDYLHAMVDWFLTHLRMLLG